jgi:ABC-type branched-subunit amino acid transport system substrate-binding protein
VLATYIYKSCQKVAILHDDSGNGRDGASTLAGALQDTNINPSPVIEVPSASPTLDTQALEIKQANPCAVALWGGDVFIAKAISALRTAGVSASIYTSQAGESPAVRALDGNAVTDGVKFVSGRMTSEGDTADFPKFEKALAADHLGPTDAGFRDAEGQEVRQPNDIDFFAYDSVNVVVAALQKQRSVQPGPTLLTDMTLVSVTSANGDARGFDSQAHEAFAFQDAYIAVIHDMRFEPVKDEALSASLPDENEILSQFDTAPLEQS